MRHISVFFVSALLLLVSCSKVEIQDISAEDLAVQDELENSTAFLKSNESLTTNFLPTFTNYYGRDWGTSTNGSSSLASEWIHEYDEDDRLIKSSFFELYPYRILKEITYLDIVEDHKLKYEITFYNYYSLLYSSTDTYELTFDEDLNIKKIGTGEVLKEFTKDGRVARIHTVAPNGQIVYQTGYEYDEQGNIVKYISYDISGTRSSTVDYTYNEKGDPLSYHFQNIYGAETKVNYYYRQDSTLERLEEEYYHDDEDFGTKIFTYTPEERFAKQITDRGDGSKQIVTYTEEEIIEECFIDDVLSDVFIFQIQEEGYSRKLHKEYLNGVLQKIRYFGADGEVEYTEYYDEDGNLTQTVPS